MRIAHGYIVTPLSRSELAHFLRSVCHWGCDKAFDWLDGRDKTVNEPLILARLSSVMPYELFCAAVEFHGRDGGWIPKVDATIVKAAARRLILQYGIPPLHHETFVEDLVDIWVKTVSRFSAGREVGGNRMLLTNECVRFYTSPDTREGKDVMSFAASREMTDDER